MNHGLNPYLKFVAPALLALVATAITAISQGSFYGPAFEVGFVGLAAATVAFIVANGPVGIRKYAKALAPSALTIIGIAIHYALNGGQFDVIDTRVAIAGGLAALVTLLVPNAPAPVVA